MTKHIKLSDWIPAPEAPECYMRIYNDTDPNNIANRVAFIEKTPRVRVDTKTLDHLNWKHGLKGSGQELGSHQPSRDWCDQELSQLGYILPDLGVDLFKQLRKNQKFLELPLWMQEKLEQLLQDLVAGDFGNWQPDHCVDFVNDLFFSTFNLEDK